MDLLFRVTFYVIDLGPNTVLLPLLFFPFLPGGSFVDRVLYRASVVYYAYFAKVIDNHLLLIYAEHFNYVWSVVFNIRFLLICKTLF